MMQIALSTSKEVTINNSENIVIITIMMLYHIILYIYNIIQYYYGIKTHRS